MTSAVLRRARPRTALAAAALGPILAGALLGGLFPQVAYRFGPALLPTVLLLAALLVLTLRRPVWGIVVALLLLPLGNLGFGYGPPWLLGAVWASVLFVMAVLRGPTADSGESREEGIPALAWAVMLLIVVTALGWTVTADPETALPATRTLVTGAFLFWAMIVFVRRPEALRLVLLGIAGGAVLVGGYATFQYLWGEASAGFFTSGGTLVSRVSAGFSHPNSLGAFLLLPVPLVVAGAVASRRRLPWLAVLAVSLFGLYASFSRGALIALAIMPLVFLGGRRALLAGPLLALLLVFATPPLIEERFATLTTSGSEVANRVDFWETAIEIWQDRPLLGVGPGGFPAAYAEARVPGKGFLPATQFQPPPHAHNMGLHLLAEQGLLGLLAFTFVVGLAVRCALRLRRSEQRLVSLVGAGTLAALAGFLVHNLVDVTLFETTAVYFWALLGFLAATVRVSARLPPDPASA